MSAGKTTKMTGFLFLFCFTGLWFRVQAIVAGKAYQEHLSHICIDRRAENADIFPFFLFPSVLDSSSWGGAVHVRGSGQPSPLNLSANPLTDPPTYAPR